MAQTKINPTEQLPAGSITRSLLNTATSGSAVATKIIPGTNITISSTGADAGTGDVTINAGSATFTGGTLSAALVLAAGTTTLAPLKFQSGSVLTTPVAGVIEYDGSYFYGTPSIANSKRGSVDVSFWNINGSYVRPSASIAQKLFNSTTNGAVNLGIGIYLIECMFSLTGLSTSSPTSVSFLLGGTGGASSGFGMWGCSSEGNSAPGAAFTTQTEFPNSAMLVVPANVTGSCTVYIRGLIQVGSGGTIIPETQLSVAAATTVGPGSYMVATLMGAGNAGNMAFQGNWT